MLRPLRIFLTVLAVVFVGGFAVFAERTTRATAPTPAPHTDAIVALTGGGGARISAAMTLLDQGAGARLFISGVNPSTSDNDVRTLAAGSDANFDCCVDLGRAARTTVGNAHEVAGWARAHGYASLTIVTSDFHMPRSMLELRRALGDVELVAYPVLRSDATGLPWWRDAGAARRLSVEYVKYLIMLVRGDTSAPGADDMGAEDTGANDMDAPQDSENHDQGDAP